MNNITKRIEEAKKAQSGTIDAFLETNKPMLAQYITGTGYEWPDFKRIALTVWKKSPSLQNCNGPSIAAAIIESLQSKIIPNTVLGLAYIIPYKGFAQFQVGYRGLLDFAYRTGLYKRIDAQEVKEGDTFRYQKGSSQFLEWTGKDGDRQKKKTTHVYAIYELTNGGLNFEVWSIDEINAHRDQYSKTSSKDTPWYTAPDEMAKKTVLKSLLKYAPKTDELHKLLAADESIKTQFPIDTKRMLDVAPDYDTMNALSFEPDDPKPDPPKEPTPGKQPVQNKGKPPEKKSIMKAKEPAKEPEKAPDPQKATEGQIKLLFAIGKSAGFEPDVFKEQVKKDFGLEHLTDITKAQVEKIINDFGKAK